MTEGDKDIRNLLNIVVRNAVKEALVSASPEHLRKETVREQLQTIIVDMINDGAIASQDQLDEFFRTIDMASRALKGVPYDVFVKMSQ